MAGSMVTVAPPHVNHVAKSFVSAFPTPVVVPDDAEAFKAGRKAYMNGKRLVTCVSDAEARGWLHQEKICADAYYAQMMNGADETPSADRQWVREHC
jgi:hypothetical protein